MLKRKLHIYSRIIVRANLFMYILPSPSHSRRTLDIIFVFSEEFTFSFAAVVRHLGASRSTISGLATVGKCCQIFFLWAQMANVWIVVAISVDR